VANPSAKSGKTAKRIQVAGDFLHKHGLSYDFLATEPMGGTVPAIVKRLKEGRFDTVIAMGGDGTFNEVAKSIFIAGKQDEIAMANLPTGTANDQGKSFGLSTRFLAMETNIEVIAAGFETKIDIGRIKASIPGGSVVREDYFFDSAGWGISPKTLAVRNEDMSLIESVPLLRNIYKGHLVYAGALFRTFLASYIVPEQFEVTLEIDGESYGWKNLCDLVVKATPIYGGLWVFDPRGKTDDGLFEVIPFVDKKDWVSKAIVHLDHTGKLSQVLSGIGVKQSENFRGKRIRLDFHLKPGAQPLSAQIDGEEFPATPRVEIEVIERALRLIVPRDYEAKAEAERAGIAGLDDAEDSEDSES
jgi:diacylglycerol kinase family enzyme